MKYINKKKIASALALALIVGLTGVKLVQANNDNGQKAQIADVETIEHVPAPVQEPNVPESEIDNSSPVGELGTIPDRKLTQGTTSIGQGQTQLAAQQTSIQEEEVPEPTPQPPTVISAAPRWVDYPDKVEQWCDYTYSDGSQTTKFVGVGSKGPNGDIEVKVNCKV